MKKVKLGKDILILAIFSLMTVLTWVGFAVWSVATKTTISKVTLEQMAPLNPTLEKTIFESLKQTSSFSEEEMNTNTQPVTATPSAESSSTPVATGSSQTATESAILE
jgi:cytoskeletal protein RodZ